jgi:putative tryptophan/tyrosine transport system substrate-binding protein
VTRRAFIAVLAGTATWPLAARAQHPVMPVIGFLHPSSQATVDVNGFRRGLVETGHIEDNNVVIEYRWAENDYERLPSLAADLVRRKVTVIVAAGGSRTALTAQAATKTIPVVFMVGVDPVKFGLAVSLNRPGGNLTGIAILETELVLKLLELLHELMPNAPKFAVLVNPGNTGHASALADVQNIARKLGHQLLLLNATLASELNAGFETLVEERAHGLIVLSDAFFFSQREQIAALAARYAVPAIYPDRKYVVASGLMSYGTNDVDTDRLVGNYAGRILKGERPADLPVLQPTRFELVINLKTARALGLEVPATLLARADEVIE